jgi:hypothetical protein
MSLLIPILLQVLAAEPAAGHSSSRFACETPAEAEPGQALRVQCMATSELHAVAVVMFHRPSGSEVYAATPALRTDRARFQVTLCPDTLTPGPVHFYFEARDAEDKVVASSGDLDDPHLLVVRGFLGQAPVARASQPHREAQIRDEDPLAAARAEREAERVAAVRSVQRPPGRIWVGFGAGYGYGFYPESHLDFRKDLRIQANTGPAGVVLLTPEVGYQVSEAFAFGVQLTWQRLSGSGIGDAQMGSPVTSGFTLLARGSYHTGEGRAQLVYSGFIGGGDGFHLVVPPLPEQGLRRNDSVRAGPVVLGPGLGLLFHLQRHAAILAETRLLAGVPNFAALLDARLGAQFSF